MRLVVHPAAFDDVVAHAVFMGADSPTAAERFVVSAQATFDALRVFPRRGRECQFADPRLRGMRSWPVQGYRSHLIFYVVAPDHVLIARVLHGASDLRLVFGPEARPGSRARKRPRP